MSLFGNQIEERNKAPLGGENPGGGAAGGNGEQPEPMNRDRERASQALLTRLMKLHMSGPSPEEIAVQALTTEPENVVFRAALMIEIILHYVRRAMEERAL
ncbi:MAG: hypothetical protein WCD04_00200 [Terriglobia bacterium]|jgi:hypothetical protein